MAEEATFQPETPVQRTKDLLQTARSVVVLLGEAPGFDQVAAATSLVIAWLNAGKDVVFASPEPLPEEVLNLVGTELCKQELGNQNLTVTFPYSESAVDKVSYHISDNQDKFTLVIKPQKGTKPLDSSQVVFGYVGVEADLVFLVGAHSFEGLGKLYENSEELFQRATTVVIHTFEPEIGLIKLNIGDTSSFSEGTARLLSQWSQEIPSDAATNLLAGVYEATDSLRSWAVTAETFETIAWLLRQGGRRPSSTSETLASRGAARSPLSSSSATSSSTLMANSEAIIKPTNPLASAMMSKGPMTSASAVQPPTTNSKSKTTPATKTTTNKKQSKTAKKEPKPGDLDYAPSGHGPGGGG